MNKKRSRDCAKIAGATGLVENSHQKFDKANIERLYGPDAIMDDRPLKRRANDNGNLDTHHGHHKDKKIYRYSFYLYMLISILYSQVATLWVERKIRIGA
ncbi:hypothetical protein RhiirB3_528238 [Rhizophagus irregularis]|nr:hypothetical protein RhiirB3_528238 [Rhizophagus irregularis]